MSFCTICQKTFKNSSSLASHRYTFHSSADKSSNGSNRKVLLPHPAFGDTVPAYGEDITKKRKRSISSDISDESESDNDGKVKRTKTKKSINEESTDEIVTKLVNVAAGLIKDLQQVSKKLNNLETEIKEVHGTFRKVDKDMDKVEDKIDENKRNINREKMFHQMSGGGIHMEMKRFYQKPWRKIQIFSKILRKL